ncbi:cyclic nucleotide-binding domain-containing protein [bacterium]|nr:cyclic nucleotide-binding domain-containing protein [bacterium]
MPDAKQKSLEDLIKSVEIFDGLETRDINKVLKVASGKKFEKEQIIFKEGDLGDCFYLIIEGRVKITKQVEGDKIEDVALLTAGDYFGEMSLLDGEPRSATVVAIEDSRLLEVRNSQFIKIVMNDDNFARKVLWAFCITFAKRLRATNSLLSEFAKRK